MENALQIFDNPEFGAIRTVEIDGEVYFVGKDVATALGYKDTINALKSHVDAEDKRGWQITTPSGAQTMTVINESGLYSLILSSNLPRAKEFKRWVTADVLPKIRKYGSYSLKNYQELAADPDFIITIGQALKAEKAKVAQLTEENAVLAQQVFEMTPKAKYYDLILQCPRAIPVTVIAKDYGMSPKKFNQLLHELGIQYKVGGVWVLYSYYENRGWTVGRTHTYTHKSTNLPDAAIHTYWTQQGRQGLYELLKIKGYLPLIELNDK